jgi:hypothetical protein
MQAHLNARMSRHPFLTSAIVFFALFAFYIVTSSV